MSVPAPDILDTLPADLVADLDQFAVAAWPLAHQHGIRRLALLSSAPGEGTSTVATLLGRVLAAHHGLRTLLFDANNQHPALGRLVPVAERGWRDAPAAARDACVATRWPNVEVCPLGTGSGEAAVQDAAALGTAIQAVADAYDLVVLDCPPLSQTGDALHAVRKADAVALVVQADRLPRERLLHSCATLDRQEIPFLGAILNGFRRVIPEALYRHV